MHVQIVDISQKKSKKEFPFNSPRMSLLADNPISEDEALEECFSLDSRFRHLYDSIRHKNLQTPFTVMITGDWGTGKTSSMRWLKKCLDTWTEGKVKDEIPVHTCNFYPWKYTDKSDVWRGLISEVMLARLSAEESDPMKLIEAGLQYTKYLGHNFLDAILSRLSSVGLDVSESEQFLPVMDKPDTADAASRTKRTGRFVWTVGKEVAKLSFTPKGKDSAVELDPLKLDKLVDLYKKEFKPHEAYLNDFERALTDEIKSWLHGKDGPKGRLVVFIDDLDRCMPDIALQVLEALKLYLNIENLVFVVGIDKTVIDKIVAKRYLDMVGEKEMDDSFQEKARSYIHKMFQTEVSVVPSPKHLDVFFEKLLRQIQGKDQNVFEELDKDKQSLLRRIIIDQSKNNPRSMVRNLNLVLKATGAQDDFIAEAQWEFIARTEVFEAYRNQLCTEQGQAFLEEWSKMVHVSTNARILTTSVYNLAFPIEIEKVQTDEEKSREATLDIKDDQIAGKFLNLIRLGKKHPTLAPLLQAYSIANLLALQPYMPRTEFGDIFDSINLPRDIIALLMDFYIRQTGDTTADPQTRPWDNLTLLDLSYGEINVEGAQAIAHMQGLKTLNLKGNNIGNEGARAIAQIQGVTNLSLRATNIGDEGAKAISQMQGPTILDFSANDIGDEGAKAIAQMSGVVTLYLRGNEISDEGAKAIAQMQDLAFLDLSLNSISDEGSAILREKLQTCKITL